MSFLDLFSTTPTTEEFASFSPSLYCEYNAPYFAYSVTPKKWKVVQGCCNHWYCRRCGIQRAKQEYGRIVEGCRTLAQTHEIYFITPTCRGKVLTREEADKGYGEWTNRFLDAARQRCKRSGGHWCYAQVTERQKRGHPHSHILTTFNPGDTYTEKRGKWRITPSGKPEWHVKDTLRSDWLQKALTNAGLGNEYDISIVSTIEGASRYVAKYLFKPSIFENQWPKGWKRVRYSQNFPKLPKKKTDAMVLLSASDWQDLARKAVVVLTGNLDDYSTAEYNLRGSDTLITLVNVD